jgi:acyl-CoA thioesterase FadM
VIETACRHGFPLRYADRIAVTAWISDYARRLVIRYDVRNLTHGRRAAHGHTTIATLDAEGRLRLETPREIIARIQA